MPKNKTWKTEVFIVPNSLRPLDAPSDDSGVRMDYYGIPHNYKELSVEVWVSNEESENWSCHQIPAKLKKGLGIKDGYFPTFLPVSHFDGKKEGDTVTYELPNGDKLELKLAQEKYRYRNRGDFATCLYALKKNYVDNNSQEWWDGVFAKEEARTVAV